MGCDGIGWDGMSTASKPAVLSSRRRPGRISSQLASNPTRASWQPGLGAGSRLVAWVLGYRILLQPQGTNPIRAAATFEDPSARAAAFCCTRREGVGPQHSFRVAESQPQSCRGLPRRPHLAARVSGRCIPLGPLGPDTPAGRGLSRMPHPRCRPQWPGRSTQARQQPDGGSPAARRRRHGAVASLLGHLGPQRSPR